MSTAVMSPYKRVFLPALGILARFKNKKTNMGFCNS